MTGTSNHYTISESNPVDPIAKEILAEVQRTTADLGYRSLVVGATARDLILHNVFERPITRATQDIDFAVAVSDWDAFHHLRSHLLATGRFEKGSTLHRIYWTGGKEKVRIPVDLIPFGAIAEDDEIAWPPDGDSVMKTTGFDDVLASAVEIDLGDGVVVTVASLAGIATLKLFAYNARPLAGKDGLDLYAVLSAYADAGNQDRLYESEIELMEEYEFDMTLAGAALLGKDTRSLCNPHTLERLQEVFAKPNFVQQLAERIQTSRFPLRPEHVDEISNLIQIFIDRLKT